LLALKKNQNLKFHRTNIFLKISAVDKQLSMFPSRLFLFCYQKTFLALGNRKLANVFSCKIISLDLFNSAVTGHFFWLLLKAFWLEKLLQHQCDF